jgi:hypothetical protein
VRRSTGCLLAGIAVAATMGITACGGGSPAAAHSASPSPPSPATIAAWLGCQLAPYSDINQQDSYDTVAYDSLITPGDPSSPCQVGGGIASDVITFASQAKETDWLHQNDLAQSNGLGTGYVALVAGPLWVVTSGSGVADNGIVAALASHGGREVTTF